MLTIRVKRKLYATNTVNKISTPSQTQKTNKPNKINKVSQTEKVTTVEDDKGTNQQQQLLNDRVPKSKVLNGINNNNKKTVNQTRNVGVRINKTTTVINPSNEKVQQFKMIQEAQQANQESGKPDPNLIPKAPTPMKPVGLS